MLRPFTKSLSKRSERLSYQKRFKGFINYRPEYNEINKKLGTRGKLNNSMEDRDMVEYSVGPKPKDMTPYHHAPWLQDPNSTMWDPIVDEWVPTKPINEVSPYDEQGQKEEIAALPDIPIPDMIFNSPDVYETHRTYNNTYEHGAKERDFSLGTFFYFKY